MTHRRIALAAGLIILSAVVALPSPAGMSREAWLALGLALTMALWWLTEALPLAGTALLPLAFAPLFGVMDLPGVAAHYSHPLIILFLGGFLLAKAIEKSGLHRFLAFTLLGFAGTSPRRVVAATMATTAFLSLWISNTAAAMVIAPVAGAIALSHRDRPDFGTALMLGVAFAATIGGMGSLIGTPPNAVFAAYVETTYDLRIGFARWAMIGLPAAAILLILSWLLLTALSPGVTSAPLAAPFRQKAARLTRAQTRVTIIAGLTALGWISRPALEQIFPALSLSDAGIAMIAAVTLFALPSGNGDRLLDWGTAAGVRWDVLILFGGGLALAGILERSGLATWIGANMVPLQTLPVFLLILAIAAVIVFIGELASNTAMAAIFLPIANAAALTLGADPIAFMLPVALAASVGFMLPVATPPNAIVFGHEAVSRLDMLRAGAPLDLVGILVTVGVSLLIGPLVFG